MGLFRNAARSGETTQCLDMLVGLGFDRERTLAACGLAGTVRVVETTQLVVGGCGRAALTSSPTSPREADTRR
jgi:hypothetical protein